MDKIWKTNRPCSICKKPYMPYRENQKTCGSEECMRANKNISRKKDEIEFFCQICNEKSWSVFPNAVLCGKKSCRNQYNINYNKKTNPKDKLRKKVKDKAVNFGLYSKEDEIILITMRLQKKTVAAIATKLKRTHGAIENKIKRVFNDIAYLDMIEEIKMELDVFKPSKATRNMAKWNKEVKDYFKNKDIK